MNCSPTALIEAAKCYRCIPKPILQSTIISLLCQWANGGSKPPEPCVIHWTPEATVVDWVAGGIPASGDLATFLTVDPTTVTDMDASARGLTEFSCPRYLPNLSTLFLNDNSIVGMLDISGCANLTFLDCSGNLTITGLNVTGCNLLATLFCFNNQITPSITGLPLPNLASIYCGINQLNSLNLGAAPINFIDAGQNNIALFVPNLYPNLLGFFMGDNQLTSCDVSGCGIISQVAVDRQMAVFASLNIGASPFYVFVSATNNAIPNTPNGVDDCLVALQTNCLLNGGDCELQLGTNSPPTSPAAIAAVIALTGAGWTVNTN